MTAKTGAVRTYVAIFGLLAFGVLFASLGAWQLQRAEASRATRAQFDDGSNETLLPALPGELEGVHRFRRVEVHGEYLDRPQFLLDNMLHDGVAGYHVLTAMRIPGRRERVLINRGWIAAGGDRRALPDVAVGSEMRAVSGRLERLPRPGMRLGVDDESDSPADAVTVLQYPTAEQLGRRLGQAVFDYQLLLDAAAPDGYLREWQAPGPAPERHVAYAGQWWALAIGAVGAAMVMGFRTARRKP